MIKYLCDRCSALIDQPKVRFSLRIELFTAYDGIDIQSEKDLQKRDIKSEIQELLEKIDKMDPKLLESEVYSRYEFDLCRKCRDEIFQKLESRQLL